MIGRARWSISRLARAPAPCPKRELRGTAANVVLKGSAMAEFDCAPVLLIAFNRPERLKAQVGRLRAVKPRRLFVAVDGPRPDRPDEADAVAQTRAAVVAVDWPCDLKTRFLTVNRGCRFAPPEAISWFLDAAGEGIVLEDDCAPTVDFLRFASELLRRYRDEPRVGMISGDNFYGHQSDPFASYRFSRHVHIWGWATWQRAWRAYDGTLARYHETVEAILHAPRPDKFRRYWRKYLRGVIENPTTWDIQWCVAMAANGWLSVTPRANLVSNVGHEAGALHTGGFVYDLPHFVATGGLEFPLVHPPRVAADDAADRRHANRSAGYLPRALTVWGNVARRSRAARALGGWIVPFAHWAERLFPAVFRI